jgi:hypothetical protein
MHWFKGHPRLVGTAIAFVVLAALISLFAGPVGIFYAAGFLLFHWLAEGISTLIDPATFSKGATPDSKRDQ